MVQKTNTEFNNKTLEYSKVPTDIEKETGRPFHLICKDLTEQGMSPTEIARHLRLKNSTYISKALNKLKPRQKNILINCYKKGIDEIEIMFKEQLGMHYKQFLEEKYINEGISQEDISATLNIYYRTLSRHIVHYGLNKTRSQSRKDAMKRGTINYNKILTKGRKTRGKTTSYSNKQEMVRDLIGSKMQLLYLERNLEDLEVVTGFNEWGILKNKEVDIPIIIIDIKSNDFKKYSIEFDGQYWHQDNELNTKKDERLNLSGWRHYVLEDSVHLNELEIEITKICNDIYNHFTGNIVI